jgi:hypothetical protein
MGAVIAKSLFESQLKDPHGPRKEASRVKFFCTQFAHGEGHARR